MSEGTKSSISDWYGNTVEGHYYEYSKDGNHYFVVANEHKDLILDTRIHFTLNAAEIEEVPHLSVVPVTL